MRCGGWILQDHVHKNLIKDVEELRQRIGGVGIDQRVIDTAIREFGTKILINNAINLLFKLQSAFLLILNLNSFLRVLFDKIASVYFI